MKLEVLKAAKSFGTRELFQDVSFEVSAGEIVGLFGRNGTGKSTLLQMIFGLLSADSLILKVDGQTVSPKEVIPNKIVGYLPQERFLPAKRSIRSIIPLYFQDQDTLDDIFYAPAVSTFEQKKPPELSQGQRKYIEILLVSHLAHPFLLLDEPFSMIDPLYKDLIKQLLQRLKTHKGILVTDHYYQDVLQISNRNYLLHERQIQTVEGEKSLRELGYLSTRMNEEGDD